MGLEHSHQQPVKISVVSAVTASVRSSSPRPSISSDSDIPYVSYATCRPIGDSPKLLPRSHSVATPSPRKDRPSSVTGHDIVVVKGVQRDETPDTDTELCRLQSIPSFLPIMRGALHVPTMRDLEVLEKLDHSSLLKLCSCYEEHLKLCAETITTEQDALATRIREIDFAVATLMNMMTERQKKYSKYAEKIGKIQEISSALKKCNMTLKETIESMETLNASLPAEEQLEMFIWTTG